MRTPCLTLVPASAAHVEAELAGAAPFAALLGAEVPGSWPPGEYDEPAQRYFLDRVSQAGEARVGWYGGHAARRPGVTLVQAHTTAANPASVRVLERSGFLPAGAGAEPGTLRFEYAAPAT